MLSGHNIEYFPEDFSQGHCFLKSH